jgi:BirA family transcriptional regulator, biotin operon repressor / biotin---[acetyl-CoA-carboxylase] ligase
MKLYNQLKHYHFESITSTNDMAKSLLDNEDFIVVTADYQTAGRGRNEKSWLGNSKDNVYCSIGFNHYEQIKFSQVIIFQALGAIAVKNALYELTNSDIFRIKYPNDVLAMADKNSFGKISGVLAEHSFQGEFCNQTIIGMGVNVRQTQFPDVKDNNPISLAMLGYDCIAKHVAEKIIASFQQLNTLDISYLFEIWRKELNIENRIAILANRAEEYIIKELLDDGRLRLENLFTKEELLVDNGDSIRYEIK